MMNMMNSLKIMSQNYRFCVNGKFSDSGQPPVCLYDENGNFATIEPTSNQTSFSQNAVDLTYDSNGRKISPVKNNINRIRVPPNAETTVYNNTDEEILSVGGTYLKDVTSRIYDAYGTSKIVGDTGNIKNFILKTSVPWDAFTNACNTRSTPALHCQNYQSKTNVDYNNVKDIFYNFNDIPYTIYKDRWIVYLLLVLFGLLVLLIVGTAAYMSYSRRNGEITKTSNNKTPYKSTKSSRDREASQIKRETIPPHKVAPKEVQQYPPNRSFASTPRAVVSPEIQPSTLQTPPPSKPKTTLQPVFIDHI